MTLTQTDIAALVIAPFIGSFLAVVATRLPAGEPIAWSRSACRSCGATLGPAALVPILSWAVQCGRCRACSGDPRQRRRLRSRGDHRGRARPRGRTVCHRRLAGGNQYRVRHPNTWGKHAVIACAKPLVGAVLAITAMLGGAAAQDDASVRTLRDQVEALARSGDFQLLGSANIEDGDRILVSGDPAARIVRLWPITTSS